MVLFPSSKTFRSRSIRQSSGWLIAVLLSCLAIAGCTTPIGVERVDPQVVYREQTRNVLAGGDLSQSTRIVLTRWDLNDRFATDPQEPAPRRAPGQKSPTMPAGSDDDLRTGRSFRFKPAVQPGQHTYYLAAAVYAFAFLFPDGIDAAPSPYDPRLRTASDLYNRALTAATESGEPEHGVQLRVANSPCHSATLRVAFGRPASLVWSEAASWSISSQIGDFTVSAACGIHYRQAGIRGCC